MDLNKAIFLSKAALEKLMKWKKKYTSFSDAVNQMYNEIEITQELINKINNEQK